MKVKILHETDINLALFGLGLSHGLTSGMTYELFLQDISLQGRLVQVAKRLAPMGRGHNKFLESIQVWLEIQAPRYVWQDLDTYRVGVTKQSEATNHTIMKRELRQSDFETMIPEHFLHEINKRIELKDFIGVKNILPESFLQKRIVNTNYKCLQNIIEQRKEHRLPQFKLLCKYLLSNLKYKDLLTGL
jgi:hypothetical protein